MAWDLHKNLAVSAVAVAPSPATSGTSLTVTTGEGARFPVAPFWASVWAAGSLPTPANTEVVRVTARSSDVFTITRAQDGTTARTVILGDQIATGITKAMLEEIEAAIDAKQALDATLTALAGLTSTAGFMVQTAADTFSVRTLVTSDSALDISSGSGVAGNPSFSINRTLLTGLPRANVSDMVTGSEPAFPLGTGAWTTYTPTLTQGVTVTKTITRASYQRIGRTIHVDLFLNITSTGTAANEIVIGLPVAALAANMPMGSGFIFDASVPLMYNGVANGSTGSSSTFGFFLDRNNGTFAGQSIFTLALAASDQIRAQLTYQAAS